MMHKVMATPRLDAFRKKSGAGCYKMRLLEIRFLYSCDAFVGAYDISHHITQRPTIIFPSHHTKHLHLWQMLSLGACAFLLADFFVLFLLIAEALFLAIIRFLFTWVFLFAVALLVKLLLLAKELLLQAFGSGSARDFFLQPCQTWMYESVCL